MNQRKKLTPTQVFSWFGKGETTSKELCAAHPGTCRYELQYVLLELEGQGKIVSSYSPALRNRHKVFRKAPPREFVRNQSLESIATLIGVALSTIQTRRRTLTELERVLSISRAKVKQVLAVLLQNRWVKMTRAEGILIFSAII
jgi:transcription initiation factor TFIIIB Brf1 subunit/transcription initiation factor TFIIB